MSTAEVLEVGGRQTVTLPAEIHIDGQIVSIRQVGSAVILEPVAIPESGREILPDGFFDADRDNEPRFKRAEQGGFVSGSPFESSDEEVVHIGPGAFVRAIVAIAWSCFRHPFSATRIDLVTGKIMPPEGVV